MKFPRRRERPQGREARVMRIGDDPLPKSAYDLARLWTAGVGDPDVTGSELDERWDQLSRLAPHVLLGRAASALNGIPNPVDATEAFLADPDLQQLVIEGLKDAATHRGNFPLIDKERYHKLREKAKSRSLEIKELNDGEIITLEYRVEENQTVSLVVGKLPNGEGRSSTRLIVYRTLGPRWLEAKASYTSITPGSTLTLGYNSGDKFVEALLQGGHPAWKDDSRISAYTDGNALLKQIYFGDGNFYPLFNET